MKRGVKRRHRATSPVALWKPLFDARCDETPAAYFLSFSGRILDTSDTILFVV
jgi:hypothetical protein